MYKDNWLQGEDKTMWYQPELLKFKKKKILTSVAEDVEKLEPSNITSFNVKLKATLEMDH